MRAHCGLHNGHPVKQSMSEDPCRIGLECKKTFYIVFNKKKRFKEEMEAKLHISGKAALPFLQSQESEHSTIFEVDSSQTMHSLV